MLNKDLRESMEFYILASINQILMTDIIFKRKIYDKLLEWKRLSDGASAVIVEGARRIGKSTIVE